MLSDTYTLPAKQQQSGKTLLSQSCWANKIVASFRVIDPYILFLHTLIKLMSKHVRKVTVSGLTGDRRLNRKYH